MNSFGSPPGGGWGSPANPGAPTSPQGGSPYPQASPYPQPSPGAPQPGGWGSPQGPTGSPYGAPGMPQGFPGMPQGMGAMPGAPPNPYAPMGNPLGGLSQAQGALRGAGSMLRVMQIAFLVIGVAMLAGGIYFVVNDNAGTGIGLVIGGISLAGTGWFQLPKFLGMVGQATAQVDGLARQQQLAATGIPAVGRLLFVQQTGRMINYNPEIAATVEVQHPQHGTYQAQTTAVVAQMAIPRAQPGAQVQVRVSPTNPQEIALLF